MVESKNYLIQAQLALVFLIPVTPHIEISNNLQLDDIPVVLFFVLFILNVFLKNIGKMFPLLKPIPVTNCSQYCTLSDMEGLAKYRTS